jgi:hypothetical protein
VGLGSGQRLNHAASLKDKASLLGKRGRQMGREESVVVSAL